MGVCSCSMTVYYLRYTGSMFLSDSWHNPAWDIQYGYITESFAQEECSGRISWENVLIKRRVVLIHSYQLQSPLKYYRFGLINNPRGVISTLDTSPVSLFSFPKVVLAGQRQYVQFQPYWSFYPLSSFKHINCACFNKDWLKVILSWND